MISSIAIIAFVIGSLVFQEGATKLFGALRVWLTTNLDWLFMITTNLVFLFCLVVAVSPLGKVRLGGADAKPEYSYLTWLAMIFSAGVGIGLLFFGVLEPVTYFQSPPPLGVETVYNTDTVYTAENVPDASDPRVQAAGSLGIAATVFHWGLQGWAIYGIVGLAPRIFRLQSGFAIAHPIRLLSHIRGPDMGLARAHHRYLRHICRYLWTCYLPRFRGATGNRWTQLSVWGFRRTASPWFSLIVFITAIAMISVMTGINVGIKRLSQFNIILAFVLLLAVIILGPTLYIFRSIFTSLGTYVMKIVPLSNWIGREDTGFFHGWTTFYWAWWIAWAPFIGTFIARISKGRTVREFVIFVLLLPTLLCLLWFSAFGGTAIHQFLTGDTGVTEIVEAYKPELALFKMFEGLPWTTLLSCIGMTLTIIFFVTSSDSGSLIIDIIAAGGKVDRAYTATCVLVYCGRLSRYCTTTWWRV